MSKIPIALQLFSVREDCKQNLANVLAQVAKMGYDGVEFAGYHDHSATDIKKMLDDNGLKAAGTHTGLPTLLGDEFDKTVEFNQAIGNPYLVVPGLGEEYRNSIEAWKKTAGIFNELAEKAAAANMRVGYHNHSHEFQKMGDEYPWDAFFGTARADVIMQLDTGNALHGGVDVVPFLERYPGRATTVHLKEFSSTNDKAIIGEGEVRWDTIFDLCDRQGATEWYIVEQESYAHPPLECVDKCLQNLRKMGK